MKLSKLIPICGIYKITNAKNGRVYIGQSANITLRWAAHVDGLANGRHSNARLLRDFQETGIRVFSAEVIEQCDRSVLLPRERFYITQYYEQGHDLYNNIENVIFIKHGGKKYVWDYTIHLDRLED